MQVLSYGYKLPETDDTGDVFFAALEFNISRLNTHSHDGTTGALLTTTTQTISSGSWSADLGGGKYRQLITLPGTLTYDGVAIEMRLSSGHVIYPTIEKVSSNTYYVYVNDNTLTLKAVYAS